MLNFGRYCFCADPFHYLRELGPVLYPANRGSKVPSGDVGKRGFGPEGTNQSPETATGRGKATNGRPENGHSRGRGN